MHQEAEEDREHTDNHQPESDDAGHGSTDQGFVVESAQGGRYVVDHLVGGGADRAYQRDRDLVGETDDELGDRGSEEHQHDPGGQVSEEVLGEFFAWAASVG